MRKRLMRMRSITAGLLTMLLSASFCAQAEQAKLTLSGSSTIAPLAAELAKRFESQNHDVQIDVQSGGSGRGISDARQGLANIGMVSRALKPEESDLKGYPIAMDGITLIINGENSISSLTDEQIIAIYTGKIKNWQEVGGKNAPITVVNKAEGRSTLELFTSYFKIINNDIKAHIVIGDNQQGIKTVSGSPNAIGYVSIGAAEYEQSQGVPIKLLPIKGIKASVENIQNQSFPLMRVLNYVTKAETSGVEKQFIEYCQSTQVSDLIKEQFFVPLASAR